MVSDEHWYKQWIGYCSNCDTLFGVQVKSREEDAKPPFTMCPFCSLEDKEVPLAFSATAGYGVKDSSIWAKFRRWDTRKNGNGHANGDGNGKETEKVKQARLSL